MGGGGRRRGVRSRISFRMDEMGRGEASALFFAAAAAEGIENDQSDLPEGPSYTDPLFAKWTCSPHELQVNQVTQSSHQ